VLFTTGRHLEFTLTWANPDVSGVEIDYPVTCESSPVCLDGQPSGDMAPGYTFGSVAYKADINQNLAYAVILDQPFGADVGYPASDYYAGQYGPTTATLDTFSLTTLLKYTTDSHFSLFGGPRFQSMKAQISAPFLAQYQASGDTDWAVGYVLGIAWEKPEIAARISLTYNSEITHELPTSESFFGGEPVPSTTQIKTPQSVNLEFQTGIAQDTLLFGSVRWAEWTVFNIEPVAFSDQFHGPIVSFADNRVTYTLGLGRKLNETWSVAGFLGYEPTLGGIASNLAPTDGFRSLGLAASYTEGNYRITTALSYIWVGEAETQIGGIVPAASWQDNTGLVAVVKVALTL